MLEKLEQNYPKLKSNLDTTIALTAGTVVLILDTLNTLTPPGTEVYLFQEFSRISNWKIGILISCEDTKILGGKFCCGYLDFAALKSASRNLGATGLSDIEQLAAEIRGRSYG